MKAEPEVSPSEDCVEKHVPDKANDDQGKQDSASDNEVPATVRYINSFQDWPNLQADENERQDVQSEYHRLPYGICR
jgi:hypothetical protein